MDMKSKHILWPLRNEETEMKDRCATEVYLVLQVLSLIGVYLLFFNRKSGNASITGSELL